jgi:hypothetical protein
MAIYYTDQQKTKIREWLLELREIVTPDKFAANRERARELVKYLDDCKLVPTSIVHDEFQRVRRIWRRLDAQSE